MCQTEPPSSASPEDLVRLYLDTSRSAEQRNRVFTLLHPLLELTARQVIRNFGRSREVAEVTDLVTHTWERLDHWDQGAGFEAWAFVVMRNRYLDLARGAGRQQLFLKELQGHMTAPPLEPAPEYSMLQEPFSSEDLEQVCRWRPVRGRVVTLCLAGMWRKVPLALWNQWLTEANLRTPFPPEYLDELEQSERVTVLTEALGVSRNIICQDWSRRREALASLSCIRELRHGS